MTLTGSTPQQLMHSPKSGSCRNPFLHIAGPIRHSLHTGSGGPFRHFLHTAGAAGTSLHSSAAGGDACRHILTLIRIRIPVQK